MKANNKSTHFVRVATSDYVAARCCLLNGLDSGFVLAQQGLEKLLKACIYLADPRFAPSPRDAHRLEALAHHVNRLHQDITFADHEIEYLKKLTLYFEGKYPDAKQPRPPNFSTAELMQIDDLFVRLSFDIPFDLDVKWRTGIFHLIGATYAQRWPMARWLQANNRALSPAIIAKVRSEFEAASQLPMGEVEIVMPTKS